MKQTYIVARNAFSVSVADDLAAWTEIQSRFKPFETTETHEPVLEVEIQAVASAPEFGGEIIYDPEFAGIGFIAGRVSRLADGNLVMEFKHVHQDQPRMWMKMSPENDHAQILILPFADGNDPHILSHALMIAFTMATTGNGSLIVHASTVIYGGKAYLFQGRSGTGKSTHATLWLENIAGTELLNDDNPVIRFAPDGTPMVYGSPWSGKTHCYRNVCAPIGAMVRIVRSQTNELQRLSGLKAYASLATTVSYLPFLGKEYRDMRHQTIERLACAVECCEMHCRPDVDAALTCMASLTK